MRVQGLHGVTACPVRFSWVGPARDKPTADDEMRDARSALDVAEDLGWSFGATHTACPQHAALEAPDTKEAPRG